MVFLQFINFINAVVYMDFRNLHTFIQVAESGSFTRAAEKLGYSQPTISVQIKQLEHELGVQLFERIGHTVILTRDGRESLAYAQRICQLSHEMIQGAANNEDASGTIRLAMADSLCSPLVVEEFAKFRQEHPHISLRITTAGTDAMFDMLDHNDVDLVCTLDNHIYNTTYVISNEEKVGVHFVCASTSPLAHMDKISLRDLLQYSFLLTEKGMSYRRLLDEFLARNSMEIHPVLEMGNADLLCRLVEENAGISFLPDYVTKTSVLEGRLVRLKIEGFDVELWKQILYHRDKWLSTPLKIAIEYLSHLKLA